MRPPILWIELREVCIGAFRSKQIGPPVRRTISLGLPILDSDGEIHGNTLLRRIANLDPIGSILVSAGTANEAISSHWDELLRTVDFNGTGSLPRSLGFGGYEAAPSGVWRALNALFQTPWRLRGRTYPGFASALDTAKRIAKAQNRALDLDVLRQVLAASLIKAHVNSDELVKSTLCVIGDGFSTFTLLALAEFDCARHVVINFLMS